MSRVKRGVMHSKRRRNLLAKASGFEAGRKSHIKLAKIAVTKAGVYAYKDRKIKKRLNRANWQLRINAAVRPEGMAYSKFMGAIKAKGIHLNRKMLAEVGAAYPAVFKKILETVKA